MTLMQSRDDRVMLAVDEDEVVEARSLTASLSEAAGALEVGTAAKFAIEIDGNRRVAVSAAMAGLVRAVIDGVGRGAQITIQSVPRELTTTTAAAMLGVSRPTLMKLVADKKLPAHKVGSHTRVLATDVAAFRDEQRESQRRAFDELRDLDQDLELGP